MVVRLQELIIDDYYDSKATPEEYKYFIRYELENLCNQLEAKFYFEIDILRINKNSPFLLMIKELLSKTMLYSGTKLTEKIKSIEYSDINASIMEIIIPLKMGYMDWNTAQAVWRINQDLRPGVEILELTIDKLFLEVLVFEYIGMEGKT